MLPLIGLLALLAGCAYSMTPEQMLSAPRYTDATPNPNGEWAMFTTFQYSYKHHESRTTWKLINLASGKVIDLPWGANVTEAVWVGPTSTSVLYVNGTNDWVPGGVTLYLVDLVDSHMGKLVAALPAPYSGLHAVNTPTGGINFVLSCLAYANNGSAYNEALASLPASTGRLYNSIFVRHWDTWITKERYAVFSGSLNGNRHGDYKFSGMKNLVHSLKYTVTRPESPIGSDFLYDDYQITPDGSQVAFLTKAPDLPKANHTAIYIYLVPHDGSSAPQRLNGPGSSAPETARGAVTVMEFSPDSKKLAYAQQDRDGYEVDRNKMYVVDLETKDVTQVAANWDRGAFTIRWAENGCSLYVTADSVGSQKLFIFPLDAGPDFEPRNITGDTSIMDIYVLPGGDALVSAYSIWASFLLYRVTPQGEVRYYYKSNEIDPELSGLGPEDVDWFWYEGINGDQQQAVIAKPENFSSDKVYDLVFYVHGGPEGYTGNFWNTRWNPKVWADQGYVVFGPNPTGSTSYGQKLTDAARGRWGSWPYEDLVKSYEAACNNLPYINCSNAVAVGASWGGYMMNWIQGHDLGRKFKAIVCQDGISVTSADLMTEELWYVEYEFMGETIKEPGRRLTREWDPMAHVKNFSTPQFIIHNELDYRNPIGQGLAMFNALQMMGVPSRFLSFPDENHWVLGRENRLYWHREVFRWINYWTGKIPTLDDNAIDM